MCPKWKSGSTADVDNWRQLEVSSQLALIQECIIVNRMQVRVRAGVLPCQTGYVRDCSDAQQLAHEVIAQAVYQGRPAWCIPADVCKAFPRTWRQDLGGGLALTVAAWHWLQAC